MPTFPSMKAAQMLRILERKLGYVEKRRRGSHRHLVADGREPILFSYHEGATIPPGVVRKILRDAGLTETESADLLGLQG